MNREEKLIEQFTSLRKKYDVQLINDKLDNFEIYFYSRFGDSISIICFLNGGNPPILTLNIINGKEDFVNLFKKDFNTLLYDERILSDSSNLSEIIRIIEERMMNMSHLSNEISLLSRYFKILTKDKDSIILELFTYGLETYSLGINADNYPEDVHFSVQNDVLEKFDINNQEICSISEWSNENSILKIVSEIEYLIRNKSRIKFEINMLNRYTVTIQVDNESNKIHFSILGEERFDESVFDFTLQIPERYPQVSPDIIPSSTIADPTLENNILLAIREFKEKWNPNKLIVDVVSNIYSLIHNISVTYDCIVCRRAILNLEDSIRCPHCNRPYHNYCWSQVKNRLQKCPMCWRGI